MQLSFQRAAFRNNEKSRKNWSVKSLRQNRLSKNFQHQQNLLCGMKPGSKFLQSLETILTLTETTSSYNIVSKVIETVLIPVGICIIILTQQLQENAKMRESDAQYYDGNVGIMVSQILCGHHCPEKTHSNNIVLDNHSVRLDMIVKTFFFY